MVPGPGSLGRLLLAAAAVLAVIGVLLLVAERFPGLRLGKLPGDIVVDRPGFKLWLPLGTSILISLVLSAVLWLLGRRG